MKPGELLRVLLLRPIQKADGKGNSQLPHGLVVKTNNLKTRVQLEFWGEATWGEAFPVSPDKTAEAKAREIFLLVFLLGLLGFLSNKKRTALNPPRPPLNAEYVLYLVLRREERDEIVGDLIEAYGKVIKRFDKRRADIWFYKQVLGSLFPLLRRQILRIGALVWLGRILRRLIS